MLIIISPAKNQNFADKSLIQNYTLPQHLDKSEILIEQLRNYSAQELTALLGINPKLATLNEQRNFEWHLPFNPENGKQAILAYDGEVYRGLNAKSLSPNDLNYAQEHLRIVSGLYGALRPLDIIQPYRLEIKTPLPNIRGENLYQFWRDTITQEINQTLKASGEPDILLNLSSAEYFKSINRQKLNTKRVIEFKFMQYYPDTEKTKTIVVYLKKARGMMARYIIQNRINTIDGIKAFAMDGYWFDETLSSEKCFVFVRQML